MGYNIFCLHNGGISIHKTLRRKLSKNNHGGVTAYVMILFGMIIILYLFGFQSIWSTYQEKNMDITSSDNEAVDFGTMILQRIGESITKSPENIAWLTGGILGTLGILIIGKLTGTTSTILQFLIPVILLVVLNIFIFPLNDLDASINFMAGTGFTIFLFAFFNLFYILAVIEFVRGTPT